jgi:hypothetical protein
MQHPHTRGALLVCSSVPSTCEYNVRHGFIYGTPPSERFPGFSACSYPQYSNIHTLFSHAEPPACRQKYAQDVACLPDINVMPGVPLAPSSRGASDHGGAGSSASLSSIRLALQDVVPMDPDAMQLPPHLKHEATALRNCIRRGLIIR